MGRRLIGFVPIHEGDQTVWYGPDDKVPAKHAKLIGDHAWVDDDEAVDPDLDDDSDDDSDDAPQPPPLGGPGSGTEEWAKYAADLEVDVEPDATREQIVEAIRDAGHPVEKSAD